MRPATDRFVTHKIASKETTPNRHNLAEEGPILSSAIRNVVVAGHRTSARLEPAMWEALRDIAGRQGRTVNELVTEIAQTRTIPNLTAAIRVYVVEYYR